MKLAGPFLLRCWGRDVALTEKVLGAPHAREPGGAYAYWFATAAERNNAVQVIFSMPKETPDGRFGCVFDATSDAADDRLYFACATFKHRERTFEVEICYGFGEHEHAEHMFRDGNYACDCNRSLFIQRQCDKDFDELDCGHDIELIDFRVERRSIQ